MSLTLSRSQRPVISAIIACYGDALAIPVMYRRLKKIFALLRVSHEIIFVNDGSADQTEAVLKQLVKRDAQVVAVHHSRNFGSQQAFNSGMQQAKGQAVLLLDGDLQDPPELLPELYRQWKAGYQVVYGVRVDRRSPWLMHFFYRSFYRVFQRMSYIKVPRDAGDFSLIDRQAVTALLSLPERDRFVRGLRAWVGFQQTGVPYVRSERVFGQSTNNVWKNIQWAIKGIFSFSFVPLQLITSVSMVTFVLSVIGIVVQIILRFLVPAPRGVTTIIVLVLFLGSVQLLSLSIIGEYLAKIFEETKQRPPFLIKRIDRR